MFILLTYGLCGVFTVLTTGGEYFKSFYKTEEFRGEYDYFLDTLTLFELNDRTKADAKKAITVTKEEIEEHRTRYGDLASQIASIENQYKYQIEEAIAADNEKAVEVYKAERDAKIADITENFKNDDHVREKIVKEKEEQVDAYFENREQYRSSFLQYQESFIYYLKDTQSGKVFTNLEVDKQQPIEEMVSEKEMAFVQYYPSRETGYFTGQYMNVEYNEIMSELTKERMLEGVIAVPKAQPASSPIKRWAEEFQERQLRFNLFAGSSVLAIILGWFLRKWARFSEDWDAKWERFYRYIPIDVKVVLLGGTGIITILCFFLLNDSLLYFGFHDMVDSIVALLMASFFMLALFLQGRSIWKLLPVSLQDTQQMENFKQEWKRSWLYRIYRMLKDAFLNRSIGTQMILLLMVVFFLGAFTVLVVVEPIFLLVYGFLFIAGVFALIILLRYTGYFNKIVQNTDELAAGRMGPDLPVKGKSVLAKLAGNINILKHGVKQSKNEQAKSERLKTELITNVSHDLRTPLTSIITYSELLKTPDLGEADRKAYIEIIDRKSKRLKVLIDDLFEASKMASGNVELVKERIDLVQLLQQALAEHNEAIEEAGLQLRIATPEKAVYALVDGQKLWRVFDNLIGNILKYSLEHTRVYITLKLVENQAVLTFKNVTKYELNENIDELYERFKRGDESRNTEGSGLGLAIAKSIIDLHQGQMDISVDGDLFKVTIALENVQ